MKPAFSASTRISKPNRTRRCTLLRNARRRGMRKSGRSITR
ncbi:DNA replication protein, partial [Neisseria gonorrhoeae]